MRLDESLRVLVYRWAYRMLRNDHDAMDATQEVLLRWVRHERAEAGAAALERPAAWLRRTTVNHCIDHLRRGRHRVAGPIELADEAPRHAKNGPGELASELEEREHIVHAIAQLSEQQRAVVIAKIYDGETFAQIAEAMHISQSSAKTHYLRALRALRESLAGLRPNTSFEEGVP
jgi:RNA polymerase sigma-70 factor (ECF subfamily)